jgi:hypothetical protein
VVSVALAALTFLLPRWHTVLWGALGLTSAFAVAAGIVLNRPARKLAERRLLLLALRR